MNDSWSPKSADELLGQAIVEYLQALERCDAFDRNEFLGRYPELAGELAELIESIGELRSLLVGRTDEFGAETLHPPDPTPSEALSVDQQRSLLCPASVSGCRFGKYDVYEVLGRGGMGIVYRAWDRRLRRHVALKLMRLGHLADARDTARFRNEIAAAASLEHPNIVPVYEGEEENGCLYFTMQLIDGSTLNKLATALRDQPRRAAGLLEPVARAVQYMHERGVLHRDLTPSNVLVDWNSIPRISDFGLARAVLVEKDLTETGEVIGTPPYMAPERLTGRKGATTVFSDVYSLGAVLYFSITARRPFEGDSMAGVLQQIQHKDPPPPRSLNPRIDRDLETICLKAMQKSPRDRYQSAAAFADDLQRYLQDRPIQARPVGPAERGLRFVQRNRLTSTLFAVSATLLLALTIGEITNSSRVSRLNSELATQLNLARTATRQSLEMLYASNMQQVATAFANNDPTQMLDLLERHVPGPGDPDLRGFEWYYFRDQARRPSVQLGDADAAGYYLCFSTNGSLLARGDATGRIQLFQIDSLELAAEIDTGQQEVNGLAFSPDGRQIASAGDDETIRIWNGTTFAESLRINAHPGPVYQLAWAPDGNRLYSCGKDSVIRVWDTATGVSVGELTGHAETVESIALSPDGRLLASAGHSKEFLVRDLHQDGTPVQAACLLEWPATSVVFAPDGRWVAVADIGGRCSVWPVHDGTIDRNALIELEGTDGIQSMAFVPGEDLLLSGDRSGMIRLWQLAPRQSRRLQADHALTSWQAHEGRIYSLALSRDAKNVISTGADGTTRIWPVSNRNHPLHVPAVPPLQTAIAALNSARKILSIDTDGTVALVDLKFPSRVERLECPRRDYRELSISADDRRIALTSCDGDLIIWDLQDARMVNQIRCAVAGEPPQNYIVAISPDGRSVAVQAAESSSPLRIHDVRTGKVTTKLSIPGVSRIAWSNSGQWLACTSRNDVVVWDVMVRRPLRTLSGHGSTVLGLSFSPDDRLLATAGTDRTVRLWDATTGKNVMTGRTTSGTVGDVCFSRDGRTLVSSGLNQPVIAWHVPTGQRLASLPPATGFQASRCVFAFDDQMLVTLIEGRGLFLLQAPRGSRIPTS